MENLLKEIRNVMKPQKSGFVEEVKRKLNIPPERKAYNEATKLPLDFMISLGQQAQTVKGSLNQHTKKLNPDKLVALRELWKLRCFY